MKTREEYNAYMKAYMLRRYYEKRQAIIAELGGACAKCGSVKGLQIDHEDPEEKELDFAKRLHTASEEELKAEITKSQLLCEQHHRKKSAGEQSVRMKEFRQRTCLCGKVVTSLAMYSGHRRWCQAGR